MRERTNSLTHELTCHKVTDSCDNGIEQRHVTLSFLKGPISLNCCIVD